MEKLDASVNPSCRRTDDGSVKDVSMDVNSIIDASTDRPTAMQVIPYLLPSKNSMPSIRVNTEISPAFHKKVDSQLTAGTSLAPVTLSYFNEDENEDSGDVELWISSLHILAKYIGAGYIRLAPAIIYTTGKLHELNVITEEQYQHLMEIFQLLV